MSSRDMASVWLQKHGCTFWQENAFLREIFRIFGFWKGTRDNLERFAQMSPKSGDVWNGPFYDQYTYQENRIYLP